MNTSLGARNQGGLRPFIADLACRHYQAAVTLAVTLVLFQRRPVPPPAMLALFLFGFRPVQRLVPRARRQRKQQSAAVPEVRRSSAYGGGIASNYFTGVGSWAIMCC